MGKIRGLAAGAAGGLLGAFLMGLTFKAVAKLVAAPPVPGEDATEKVAGVLAKKVTGKSLWRSEKRKGGQIVHLAFGASVGAAYRLLVSSFPRATAGAGTLFGAAVYIGAHGIAVPALGLARSPLENRAVQEAPEFAGHIVYGIATETVRCLLSE